MAYPPNATRIGYSPPQASGGGPAALTSEGDRPVTETDWAHCTRCGHPINPDTQVCDEAWRHLPCDLERGCIPDREDASAGEP